MGKNSYDLSTITKLVEERERINTKLLTYEKPAIIIKDNNSIPLYKVCMSPFGDFMIFANANNYSKLSMLPEVRSLTDFVDRGYDRDVMNTYAQVAKDMRRKSKKANSSISVERGLDLDRLRSDDGGGLRKSNWKPVFILPINRSLEFFEDIFEIFKDDISNNEEGNEPSESGKESIVESVE